MANESFDVVTNHQYVAGKIYWSSTKDEANNRSTVNVEMRLSRTIDNGYSTYGTGEFSINIDGTSYLSGSKSFTLTYNSNTLVHSASKVVNHNDDGSKSITIAWDGNTDVFDVSWGSGTAVLDKIDRGVINININGAWKTGQAWININGTWKKATGVFVNANGTWKRSK